MKDVPSPPVRRRERSAVGSPANRTSYTGGIKPVKPVSNRFLLRSQSRPSTIVANTGVPRPSNDSTAVVGKSAVLVRGRPTGIRIGGKVEHPAETSSAEDSDVNGCQREVILHWLYPWMRGYAQFTKNSYI